MTVHHRTDRSYGSGLFETRGRAVSSFGHLVAIGVNLVLLYIVRNLGEWNLLSFLTEDYDRVVGPLSLSIIATIVGRALRIVLPGRRIGLLIDGVVTAFGFYALLRIFQIFPLEFDPDGFRWDLLVRFVLVVGLLGSAIGVLVTPLRMLQGAMPTDD
ncbi:MAG: hypothetical protein OES24_02740 [Acidimicrobiia bacterium]|nr:hypothetical protein [Acidimicrobiia bacterium]